MDYPEHIYSKFEIIPGGFFSNYSGRTWCRSKYAIEESIRKYHMETEWAFERKATK